MYVNKSTTFTKGHWFKTKATSSANTIKIGGENFSYIDVIPMITATVGIFYLNKGFTLGTDGIYCFIGDETISPTESSLKTIDELVLYDGEIKTVAYDSST